MIRSLLTRISLPIYTTRSTIHSSVTLMKIDRREMVLEGQRGLNRRDGVDRTLVDAAADGSFRLPDEQTPNELFDGVPFNEIPILHIKVSKNNMLMLLVDHKGNHIMPHSCSREGFKHCRKGTNIAAQQTGISMAAKMTKAGYRMVRVCVKGMGPGRSSSVKGLVMGGTKVVSITDTTPYRDFPSRPRAAKSI